MDFFAFIQPDSTITNLDPHREEQTRACACGGGRDRWAHMWRWGKCVGEQGKEAVVVAFMICVIALRQTSSCCYAKWHHTDTHTHTSASQPAHECTHVTLQVVCKQRAIEVARRRGLPSGHHVTVDVASRRKCARNARNEKLLSRQTYSKATHGLPVACFSLITSQIFLPAINDHRAIDVAHQHKKQVTPAQERRTSRAREGSGRK